MPYNNIISRSKVAALQKVPVRKGGAKVPIVTLLQGKKKGR